MTEFTAGKYDAVHVAYMSFQSVSRQTPQVLQLLPLSAPKGTQNEGKGQGATVDYDFTPDAVTLLKELLPITVETTLFQCFNEAVVGEQIARMVAMKSATDSAGKMGKELSRRFTPRPPSRHHDGAVGDHRRRRGVGIINRQKPSSQ